ncbi:DEAD/DEAH box helicase [Vibrio parahaemolyticus]|uniref:DEAD/DEAH box helicase n=1 Tax=Vibrio parahaemolyticus TaxID=670 RepID=UPI0032987670
MSQITTMDRIFEDNNIRTNPFSVLAEVSKIVNGSDDKLARDAVIFAMEKRELFGQYKPILDKLTRSVGLFPYVDFNNLDINDKIAYRFNQPTENSDIVFHREQAEVYRALMSGENVVLSAPKSFGKSLIIDKLIATERYDNIVIIVPTIALIDELRKKCLKHNAYKIITHFGQEKADKNIFVLTQERAVERDDIKNVDLFVIDEFYKLDPAAEGDEERAVVLNIALYSIAKTAKQLYMLGPNINEIPPALGEKYRCRFFRTDFNTVSSKLLTLKAKPNRKQAFLKLIRTMNEPTLIYAKSPGQANTILKYLIDELPVIDSNDDVAEWVADNYHEDWNVVDGYRRGISVHHGKITRSIGQLNVRLFNEGKLKFLICTSSLIEGVNTVAKNVVIYESKVAEVAMEYFTFKNIQGRAGRMFEHFVGHIYTFDEPPAPVDESVDIPAVTIGENIPESLAVQLDEQDITNEALKNKLEYLHTQTSIPFDIFKELKGVPPSHIIALANDIYDHVSAYHRFLCWNNRPTYEQVDFCNELLFRYLTNGKGGIRSSKQLTFWWNRLKRLGSGKDFILDVYQNDTNVKTMDKAIEASFDFERRWANYMIPRLYSALDKVQKHIFGVFNMPAGDYSSFIAQVENLYEVPELIALDEYGLPLPIAKKIRNQLTLSKGLDETLTSLRLIKPSSLYVSDFERKFIEDAIKNI